MCFIIGNTYTRKEIYNEVGGEQESYLPQYNNTIVCGCFNPKKDPQAPYVILVGKGKDIEKKARMLSRQQGSIPVFVKREVKHWEYKGEFYCNRYSINQSEINVVGQISERDDITGILYLNQTSWFSS